MSSREIIIVLLNIKKRKDKLNKLVSSNLIKNKLITIKYY